MNMHLSMHEQQDHNLGYFLGKVLPSLQITVGPAGISAFSADCIARNCYILAAAMLRRHKEISERYYDIFFNRDKERSPVVKLMALKEFIEGKEDV